MITRNNNNQTTTKTHRNLEDPSPIIEVPLNVKFFFLHIHTRNFFTAVLVLKLTKNQIRKYFENKKISLLVIYSDINFVCQKLPELQDRNINQLFRPERTAGKCFLANIFVFRILTNKRWIEISLPLHRGVDVSFQEITCWFSEMKNVILSRTGLAVFPILPENWYQEVTQGGEEEFTLYDLANCSLFATFVLHVKDLEEKVYSL